MIPSHTTLESGLCNKGCRQRDPGHSCFVCFCFGCYFPPTSSVQPKIPFSTTLRKHPPFSPGKPRCAALVDARGPVTVTTASAVAPVNKNDNSSSSRSSTYNSSSNGFRLARWHHQTTVQPKNHGLGRGGFPHH